MSGSYLLVVSPAYAGLGNPFASGWVTLILVKHVVIVGLVALALVVHREGRRLATDRALAGPQAADEDLETALRRLTLAAEATTGLGAVVVLLTAAATS